MAADGLVQVVDDNGNPIGGATKKEIWAKGLKHQIIRICVFDVTGRMLLQKRAATKFPSPGCWDSAVSGHVDEGETYEQAAERELHEELGIQGLALIPLGDYYNEVFRDGRHLNRFTRTYKAVLEGSSPILRPDPEEVDSIEWMELDTIKQLVHDHPDQVTHGLGKVIELYF